MGEEGGIIDWEGEKGKLYFLGLMGYAHFGIHTELYT